MAFTGDLEHLPIVDIIQLIHTTRRSGTFSVKGSKGEIEIVFSSGDITGAKHVDNKVCIESILVKMGAVTIDDLKQAFGIMKAAGRNSSPLIVTLITTGKLKREDALRGLKKLTEITIGELMSWTKGTFTLDTDATALSFESGYSPGERDSDVRVDTQMVLMDALCTVDERERDRLSGKDVPSYEEFYSGVLPAEIARETEERRSEVTADDLGLADIDRLEKKIPQPVSDMEIFDPVEIHRRKIKELLAGFPVEEQEVFVSFLKRSLDSKASPDAAAKQAGKAIVIFSDDALIRHSVVSICKDEGVLAFATGDEKDLDRIMSQCIFAMRMPIVVFDNPQRSEGGFSEERIISLRNRVRGKYSALPVLQLASPQNSNFILQSYNAGVRAVFPKPLKEGRRETYIHDTIRFLDALKSYIKGFQCQPGDADKNVKKLKDNIASLRGITNPSDVVFAVLTVVSEMFERAITFVVRPTELIGERAIGVGSQKSRVPTPADRLKIPTSKPSAFRDVLEKGRISYGESGDDTLKALFKEIGKPLSPSILLLPLIRDRKVVAVIYGDFGEKKSSPVQLDILEILSQHAGIVLEYALFRRQATKAAQQ